jgi:hypothetical protein
MLLGIDPVKQTRELQRHYWAELSENIIRHCVHSWQRQLKTRIMSKGQSPLKLTTFRER